jgi:hypothetical protein
MLRQEVRDGGVAETLDHRCGVGHRSPISRSIATVWERFAAGWHEGNLLLSLERLDWAWRA